MLENYGKFYYRHHPVFCLCFLKTECGFSIPNLEINTSYIALTNPVLQTFARLISAPHFCF